MIPTSVDAEIRARFARGRGAHGSRSESGRTARIGRFALSAGHAGVTQYLLTHLLVPHGRRARIRRAVLPWLPAPWREALLFEAASDGVAGVPQAREVWERAVDFARAAGLGWARDGGWILLGDPPGRDRLRLTMFLFPRSRSTPAAVLKLRAGHAAGPKLAGEWEALTRVAQLHPCVRETVPTALAYSYAEHGELLIESALEGTSAYVALKSRPPGPRTVEARLATAAAWLAAFHGPVHDKERLTSIGHGDYWAHNLLFSRTREWPAVVDWEHFRADAPRFLDLFHFPLSYVLLRPWSFPAGSSAGAAFRHGFVNDNAVSRTVRVYLHRYCRDTGVAPESLRSMLDGYLLMNGLPVPGRRRADPDTKDLAARCRELLDSERDPAFLRPCALSS